MNIVLEDAVEEVSPTEKHQIFGQMVRHCYVLDTGAVVFSSLCGP